MKIKIAIAVLVLLLLPVGLMVSREGFPHKRKAAAIQENSGGMTLPLPSKTFKSSQGRFFGNFYPFKSV